MVWKWIKIFVSKVTTSEKMNFILIALKKDLMISILVNDVSITLRTKPDQERESLI
jgi:hypothetical protein